MSTLIKLWEEKDWDSIIAKAGGDFHSAFAKLFLRSKEHNENNYKDVIEDASKALVAALEEAATAKEEAEKAKEEAEKAKKEAEEKEALARGDKAKEKSNEFRRIRAFAYYLSGNYERAIFDCEKLGKKDVFANELRGMIASNVDDYSKVITNCKQLEEVSVENELVKSAFLLETYIKTCKKIK